MGYFYVTGVVFILLFAILLFYMFKEAYANRTLVQYLSFSELPASFNHWTIFFISDIHRRIISEKIIQNAKGKADIVIIGGDLAEKGVQLERVKKNLAKLKRVAPVYFVWGNNDYELDQIEFKRLLIEMEINMLKDDVSMMQSHAGERIALIGIDYFSTEGLALKKALQKAPNSTFKILVSHDPKVIDSVTSKECIQLILSGHTHGGQIRIFGYGPYDKGELKMRGNSFLLTSNGYGTTALPLRLGAKAETHLITLLQS